MKQIFTLTAALLIAGTLFAQSPEISGTGWQKPGTANGSDQQNKLGAGESIILSPNPVWACSGEVQITAINVAIFSYNIFNGMGQIVEIENLSGRPDPTWFTLPDGTLPGIYYVRFDTDSGMVIRKLMVN
jgi:hypothetical protein